MLWEIKVTLCKPSALDTNIAHFLQFSQCFLLPSCTGWAHFWTWMKHHCRKWGWHCLWDCSVSEYPLRGWWNATPKLRGVSLQWGGETCPKGKRRWEGVEWKFPLRCLACGHLLGHFLLLVFWRSSMCWVSTSAECLLVSPKPVLKP